MHITAIKQQVKRQGRYSVYVDGKFAFGLSEAALISSGLASGQELTPAQFEAHKKAAGLDKAYGNALRYVVMRPRSTWELRDYFRRKQVDDEGATQIITRLESLGLVNDRAFAEAWVANRRLLKPVSKRRLQLELRQKHVASNIIDEVLAEDETDERDTLRQLIAKKRSRYADPQKLMQYLARQGFGCDDIKTALSELAEE